MEGNYLEDHGIKNKTLSPEEKWMPILWHPFFLQFSFYVVFLMSFARGATSLTAPLPTNDILRL